MKRLKFSPVLLIAVCACVIALSARAEPVVSTFNGVLDTGLNDIISGGGNGYPSNPQQPDGGIWYEYPQGETTPSWWNQWFFNNEEIAGWKDIFYDIYFTSSVFTDAPIEVAINWSNEDWTDPSLPPLPGPGVDDSIVRYTIWETALPLEQTNEGWTFGISNVNGDPILIEDYNPVWVSIDVRSLEPFGDEGTAITLNGTILHEHHPVPEPSLMLASLGLIGYLSCRRRRRA